MPTLWAKASRGDDSKYEVVTPTHTYVYKLYKMKRELKKTNDLLWNMF